MRADVRGLYRRRGIGSWGRGDRSLCGGFELWVVAVVWRQCGKCDPACYSFDMFEEQGTFVAVIHIRGVTATDVDVGRCEVPN
jgi:hypothetical protein